MPYVNCDTCKQLDCPRADEGFGETWCNDYLEKRAVKYIDADNAFRILSEEAAHRIRHSDGSDFDVGRTNGMTRARDIIKELPAADVVPVKRGEWVDYGDPDEDGNVSCRCSLCYAGETHAVGVVVPYCWKCGANMK